MLAVVNRFQGHHCMAALSLDADLSQLATIRRFVLKVGSELGLDECTIDDLQLATEEACTNVIRHGYGGQGGTIELSIEAAGGGVRVTVRDWGKSFDPEAVPIPDVTAPLEERRLGGLGLYLMRHLMDEVSFEFDADEGNTLTMFKRL
jgi:anti-sigma regulatory factor (Ser/Thr protein kinase)